MTTRLLVAYGLMALMVVAAAALAYWVRYNSHSVSYARRQKHNAARRERNSGSLPHE
jgi:hypothetical protein